MKVRRILFIVLIILVLTFCFIFGLIIIIKNEYKTNYKEEILSELGLIEFRNENLTLCFVLSVIKAESSFKEDAKSASDAFGLMQLTYSTAKEVASKLGLKIEKSDLFNPKINIKLGVNYFQYLFSNFSDKRVTLMCYNAGITRVNEWIKNGEIKEENNNLVCPFSETNNYIKRVLQNEKIYEKII